MNEVGSKVQELMKDHVQSDVYDVGTKLGRKYYHDGKNQPTGQLEASVIHTDPETKGNEVSVSIHNDASLMEFDSMTYLHGSTRWTPNDVREMLPYFINEGVTGSLFGPVWEKLKRPYISNTFDELVEKDLVAKWMKEALKKRGITCK